MPLVFQGLVGLAEPEPVSRKMISRNLQLINIQIKIKAFLYEYTVLAMSCIVSNCCLAAVCLFKFFICKYYINITFWLKNHQF
jgi:hypothetical protein